MGLSANRPLSAATESVAPPKGTKVYKEGTWTRLLKSFAREVNDIAPSTIESHRQNFAKIAALEAMSGQVDIKSQRHVSHLDETKLVISSNLDQLAQIGKKNVSIDSAQLGFRQQFEGLSNSIDQIKNDRSELHKAIQAYLQEKQRVFTEALKAILAGKPKAEVKQMLDQLDNRLKDLTEKLNKIDKAEHHLQNNLNSLSEKTTLAVSNLKQSGALTAQQIQQYK